MEKDFELLKEHLEEIRQHQESIERGLREIDEDKVYLGTLNYDNFKAQDLVREAMNLVEDIEMKL